MRRISVLVLGALLCLSPLLAQAQLRTEGDVAGAKGVYQAEVAVDSQSDADRGNALARAFGKVLAQLTGDRNVVGRPGVVAEMRKANDYVQGYDYRQDQGTSPSGAPLFRTTLVARFKPDAIDQVAGVLGLPVWPQPRPKPVVWLAIDDGHGPRLVGLPQFNAARPLLNRASERGFALGLPAGNAAEQALAAAIWRGDTDAVARASGSYQPPMQLIGKLYRQTGGWKADWIFVDSGKVLSTWSATDVDARRLMATGADGAADALVARYAKKPVGDPAGTYRVAFGNLRGNDDWLRLSAALQNMAVVQKITPVHAEADKLVVDLYLASGLGGFRHSLGDDAPFSEVVDASAAANAPVNATGSDATVANPAPVPVPLFLMK